MPCLSLPTRIIAFTCLSLGTIAVVTHEVAAAVVARREASALQLSLNRTWPGHPVMLGDALRLDQVRAGRDGRSVVFCFTLLSDRADEVTLTRWKSMVSSIWTQARGNEALQPLFSEGYAVVYEYVGRDGRQIGTLTMRPQDML